LHFVVAQEYATGEGAKQDLAQVADWYQKAANQGLAEAELNLGPLYNRGDVVSLDSAQAAGWYRKAALEESAEAQYKLGSKYAGGQGLPVNFVEVYYWLDLAASTWSGSHQQVAIQVRNTVAARLLLIHPKRSSGLPSGWLRIRQ
jgi:hypothetical protein